MRSLIIILILTTFYSTACIAQQKGDFSIETNIFKVAEDSYTYSPSNYMNKAAWFNGLNLGYNLNNQFRPYVAFLFSHGKQHELSSIEDVEKEEFEYRLGTDFIINPNNKFVFTTGVQYFNRESDVSGFNYTDVAIDYEYEINHEIRDYGFAFTGGVKYSISDTFYVYSKSRFGSGNFHIEAKDKENATIKRDYKSNSTYEEPISAMGLAIVF